MLYEKYLDLFYKKKIRNGFSERLPDFANKYWLFNLEKSLKNAPKNSILDIGAGDGRLSILLSNFFENVFSLEVQVDKDHWSNILYNFKNIKLVEGLLQDKLSFLSDNKIDFVLLSEVFEHIPVQDVNDFFINLKSILNKNSYIFLTTPNIVVQGSAEDSPIGYKNDSYGHYRHYSLTELKEILLKNNFDIEFYAFECNNFKLKFYNKIFYPISRLDGKILNTKKISKNKKLIYKIGSYPILFLIKYLFKTWSKIIFLVEKNLNKENNSNTIIILAKYKG